MSEERITTPFGAHTTAAEVIRGIDLGGKRAIVTGGAGGIGLETARALASAGAEVTLAVRDESAGERAAAGLRAATGNRYVFDAPLDLASRASVAAFAAAWTGPLHILVNNAGIMMTPELRTREGWELQFATNHLGHFALTAGLHRALAKAHGARVASVSSRVHVRAGVDFGDIHFRRRPYDPPTAYAQSKTANVLFAVEASRRWRDDGITVNALHPGAIVTSLMRHMDPDQAARAVAAAGEMKSVEQGAATSVLVAVWPGLEGVGGRYFEDCNQAARHVPGTWGAADHALDPEAAARLWDVSMDMLAD
jgi:NAD(P)-dependent dehydrogenase (short-subunit alcohol dehydrogenase family)